MNLCIIKGRLTASPEAHTSNNGTTYCNFTVAVNRRFKKDETDFINCTAFGKQGEFLGKYFSKGSEILCSGELHIDKYQKDGESRTSAKLIVDNAEFCGSKKDNAQSNTVKEQAEPNVDDFVEIGNSDDLPF